MKNKRAQITAALSATTLPPNTPLCTILRLLTTYVFLGRDAPTPTEDMDLYDLLLKLPIPDSYDSLQTLLSYVLEAFLLMADERSFRHRPVLGGWRQPNRCTKADVKTFRYKEKSLASLPSSELYTLLARDLRQLWRLARAAQLDYQHERREAWKLKHPALAACLLRVHQVALALSEIGGNWFAEVCLRRCFRDLWAEQFGRRVTYPDALAPSIEPVRLTLALRNAIIIRLRPEREEGFEPPAPFAEMFHAWEAGEWPQSLTSDISEEEWAAQVPARFL
jgi:hypothetical protein